jgi:glycosyltransferase involved in cell wall biosynthesis
MKKSPLSAMAGEVIANEAIKSCPEPALTVLISLYNYSAYIEGCLESVCASRTDGLPGGFEVVVVDDGSTDASVKVVERYMATHELPLCLVKKPLNTGLADTRNVGLKTARSRFIFILDADNEIRPECLQAHYQAIATSDCAMVYGLINQFDQNTRKSLRTVGEVEWDVGELVSRSIIDAMAMVRKETVLRVGGYSTEYGRILPQGWEDYDLWLKLAQAGYSGKLIPQVLSDYRVHTQSMIRTTSPYNRELAVYFSRKFHFLVESHPNLPMFFGMPGDELAMASREGGWLQSPPEGAPAKLVHRVLGKKMCRSICKRLASVCHWLYP